jgi:octaprenyl-diphosphate synthase
MASGRLGQVPTAREIFDLIKGDLRKVEREIALESVASVKAITEIGRYLQASGGKRLRPSLVLLVSKMVGEGGPAAIRMA